MSAGTLLAKRELYDTNNQTVKLDFCGAFTVGAPSGRPQRWTWNVFRFDGKVLDVETFRAANGRPYGGIRYIVNSNLSN